jgi:RNA polymerase sigma-70 factor, ECF subfamily
MTEVLEVEVFMMNYQDRVYSTALRLLGNETDAQDIAQTVFLKAYEAFESLAPSPSAGGWLKTVTRNLCLNHLTRYRNRWRFFSDLRGEDDAPDFVDTVAAPEKSMTEFDEAERRHLLERALGRLPETQRVPLVLYHFDDLAYEEIAERLGSSLSKVKTDIHRGRLALRKYLQPTLAGDERLTGESAPSATRPSVQ